MTNPKEAAEAAAGFLAKRIGMWKAVEEKFMEQWNRESTAEKKRLKPEEETAYKSWDRKP